MGEASGAAGFRPGDAQDASGPGRANGANSANGANGRAPRHRRAPDAAGVLAGPWHRILALTAQAETASPESDFVSVLPAVLSAAERGEPFVTGWLSRGGGAPLELITNAGALGADAGPGGPDPGGLLFPAGGRGAAAGDDWCGELDRMVWAPCPGRQAPPLDQGPPRPAGVAGSSLPPSLFESTLVTLMGRAFGWLVIAEPTGLIDAEAAELRSQLNVLRRFEEERSRLDADRAQRRMTELDAFREAGLWSVRVLVGAASAAELRRLAPVLVGSVDLGRHPYRLRSAGGPRGELAAVSLAEALTVTVRDEADAAAAPFAVTAGVLAALAGLPRREVPGVRVLDPGYFDVTSETDAAAMIELGAILDGQDRPVGTFRVPLATLNRHAFVTGATGAGKSQTVRHILEQCTRAGLPWLAIEPAKSEYAAMAGRIEGIGQVTVINPSDPRAVPLSVNPLAPEPGYPVQAHIDMVRALFQAAFDAEEPFPQIMSQALQRVYEAAGWDVVTGGGRPGALVAPAIPTLAQLQRAALDVIEDVGYGRELQADVRGFVDVRLRSLRIGSAGRFFEGGHPADIGELLRRNVVLAIEDVANDEDKAFLMGTLIIRLVEHLRLRERRGGNGPRGQRGQPGRPDRGGLRHVIVIEEAHRLLRQRGAERSGAHAVELFAGMLAEIRAYGEGIIVAEQIPAKLVPDAVKNTALKIVHRLPAQDDRQVVGAAMNLDGEQSRQVVSLPPGVAAVFADGMDRPLRIRVPLGEGKERPLSSPPPPLRGRRSAACGQRCAAGRPCTLVELRGADLLSAADGQAWLRIWTETLVLAFLTNRSLPMAPARLLHSWSGLDPRMRECALATLIERSAAARAASVRGSFDSRRLAASISSAALRILDGGGRPGVRAGQNWVVPQLRWLHEIERVCPLDRLQPDPYDRAPPLEFDLVGAADWPDMRIGHRICALRRHALSMELAGNRRLAWNLLVGDDDQGGFLADLAVVMVGLEPARQLRQVAAAMDVPGWLGVVLSWPRRFIAGSWDEDFMLDVDEPGWPAR